ncbi:MAG: ATPase [Fimbriimonadales bacterium]|nr:MAG: ATPase [Fimbriimonadales bacterium]
MRSIAVTSGKGGVGKTNISSNLAIALAQQGHRVVVMDADLGLANLDVVLGTRAACTLQHVCSGEKRLREILTDGPGGIRFIAGGSGVQELINLTGNELEQFLAELAELESETDFLIFDTGAGVDESVMTFALAADEVLLVTTPDPASITDAYATAKLIFANKPSALIRVVLNMVADEAHAQSVFARLQAIARQFLGKKLHLAGYVRQDPNVVQAIRRREPFVLALGNRGAGSDILRIAAAITGAEWEPEPVGFFDRLRFAFGGARKKTA